MSKILSLFLVIGFLGSCSGDDGADGIDGANGINGIDGVDGTDGVAGADGSVDIIYSDWVVFAQDVTIIANDSGSFQIEAPEITQDILDTGVIMVYGKNTGLVIGNTEIYPFPAEVINEVWSFEVLGTALLGNMKIKIKTVDGGDLTLWLDTFRYVIIPAHSAEAEVGARASKEYSKMSYEEMKTLFNIPD